MQASIHRLREYQDASAQFCKRLIDYLEITFQHQSDQALSNFKKTKRSSNGGMLQPHTSMGEFLMMYEGLVLYVKEMDEVRYQRLCSVSHYAVKADVRTTFPPSALCTKMR